jgi:hypothetical protein
LSLSKTSACSRQAFHFSPLLTRAHARLKRNIDSTVIEKISPHNSDLMKSILIRNFDGGGALVSCVFYRFMTL